MITLERIKNSTHDAIFVWGCLWIVLFGLWLTGYIGGTLNWLGSDNILAGNYEENGFIDKAGKYHTGKIK